MPQQFYFYIYIPKKIENRNPYKNLYMNADGAYSY